MRFGALMWKSRTLTSTWVPAGRGEVPWEEDEQAAVTSASTTNPARATVGGVVGMTEAPSEASSRSLRLGAQTPSTGSCHDLGARSRAACPEVAREHRPPTHAIRQCA